MTKNTHFVRRFIENATNIMLSLMGSKFFSCRGDLYDIYMSIKSNLKGLSIDVLDTNVSRRGLWKTQKNDIFLNHFLDVKISVTMGNKHLILSVVILDIIRDGMVSQFFFI